MWRGLNVPLCRFSVVIRFLTSMVSLSILIRSQYELNYLCRTFLQFSICLLIIKVHYPCIDLLLVAVSQYIDNSVNIGLFNHCIEMNPNLANLMISMTSLAIRNLFKHQGPVQYYFVYGLLQVDIESYYQSINDVVLNRPLFLPKIDQD